MPRFDVTTFGEGGLQLSVGKGYHISRTKSFDVRVSGTEGGVVSNLSQLGWKTAWVSGLAKTFVGERVAFEFRSAGVDTSKVVWCETGRTSVYYVEYASPPRPIKVLYDRKKSCLTQITASDIDWEYLLDTRIIHLTGITVPLSDHCQEIVRKAFQQAKKKEIVTSFDVNYRNLLWEPKEAQRTLELILPDVDILFCNKRDAETVMGYTGESKSMLSSMAQDLAASYIVMSDSENGVYGWDGQKVYHAPAKEVEIIDRIGAGDALAAGVLHGYLQSSFRKGLQYGVTMSAISLGQYGEIVLTNSEELESMLVLTPVDIVR